MCAWRCDGVSQSRSEVAQLRCDSSLAVELHEDWIEAHRYLNMEMLREQRKQIQLLEALKVSTAACSQTGCSRWHVKDAGESLVDSPAL
jgi:hypothetical protein